MTTLTMLKAIERRYDVFTGDERFRLAALAWARRDMADAKRLGDTCPEKTYRMRDLEFQDRIRGLVEVVESMLLVLQSFRGRACREDAILRAVHLMGDMAGQLCALAYRHGWEDAIGTGKGKDPPADLSGWWWSETADRWGERFAPVFGDWRPELAAFWQAADQWTRETTGADACALITGMYDDGGENCFTELATWAAETAPTAEPDPVMVTEARAALDRLWATLTRP